jgi:2'-5' RNA ligase
MGSALNETLRIYERLWGEAMSAFERNDLEFDFQLLKKPHDLRRGLTLVFRPDQNVQASIAGFLRKLADVAPGQHFYRPAEFHVTVLSIIPGSELCQDKIQHLAAYQSIIREVLQRYWTFSIMFQGVTASPGAVMIQGFPGDDTLARLREDLRESLRRNNFGDQLDVRYKINAAHLTVMRFCKADADWARPLALLKANRTTDFGETKIAGLELIWGDWYASAETVRTLAEYPLAP